MTCSVNPIECKLNYAFSVSFNMPHDISPDHTCGACSFQGKPLNGGCLWLNLIDKFMMYGKIRLTVNMSYLGDRYHGRLSHCKIESTWPKWHIKSSSGGCYRRFILRQRVFRPSRLGAGQVRDASTSAERWRVHFKDGKNVWLFSCFILPSTAHLRSTRISWPNAAQARPQARPQINRRCDDVYFGLQKQKIFSWGNGSGSQDKTTFWLKCTSPQYRTGIAASTKKGALNLSEPNEGLEHCVERYEQLRQMILVTRDYCCQDWGLALLMHRGFSAWIYAISKIESFQQPPEPTRSVPEKTNWVIPDTIRGRMIMSLSEMMLSALQEVAL